MAVTKCGQFKQMLHSPQLEFLMEAHNGLSARIVEEAGFRGIWASGLSISAALGVRDNNEASWTQVLEVVEFMSDATTVPILFDGDTGFGKSVAMIRYLNNLPGIPSVPHEFLKAMMDAPVKQQAGMEIAASFLKDVETRCQGAVLIALGWGARLPEFLDLIGR